MDHLDLELATKSQDTKLHSAVRAALTFSRRILNKYYNLTDASEAYRIAMGASSLNLLLSLSHSQMREPLAVLHLSYKLRYFKLRDWEKPAIDTARELVESEFAHEYADVDTPDTHSGEGEETGSSSNTSSKVRSVSVPQ